MSRSTIFAAVLGLTLAAPAVASDLETLAARAIDAQQRIETIEKQRGKAEGSLGERQRMLQQGLYALDRAPAPQDELSSMDRQIDFQVTQHERASESGMDAETLQTIESRIKELRFERDAMSLTDDAAKQEFRQRIDAELEQINAELAKIHAPFNAQIDEIRESVDADNKALAAALQSYFLTPQEGTKVEHMNATMSMAFAGLEWNDAEGDGLAWAHIRIRPLSDIQDYDRNEMLDGKYPLRTASDQQLWVWAGHFLVTFVPRADELTNEAKLREAVAEYVDLEGLAQIQIGELGVASVPTDP